MQNTKRSHKKRTKDLWNTRRETQIQIELDQPSRKNGQHALNYKPRGRRDRGRPRKRWQCVDAGTGQTTKSMEKDDDDDDNCAQYNAVSNIRYMYIPHSCKY